MGENTKSLKRVNIRKCLFSNFTMQLGIAGPDGKDGKKNENSNRFNYIKEIFNFFF